MCHAAPWTTILETCAVAEQFPQFLHFRFMCPQLQSHQSKWGVDLPNTWGIMGNEWWCLCARYRNKSDAKQRWFVRFTTLWLYINSNMHDFASKHFTLNAHTLPKSEARLITWPYTDSKMFHVRWRETSNYLSQHLHLANRHRGTRS